MTEEGIQRFRGKFREYFEGDPQRSTVYRDVSRGSPRRGSGITCRCSSSTPPPLFDYLPPARSWSRSRGGEACRSFGRETTERYERLRHDRERPILPPATLFLDSEQLEAALTGVPHVFLAPCPPDQIAAEAVTSAVPVRFDTRAPPLLPVNSRAERPHAALLSTGCATTPDAACSWPRPLTTRGAARAAARSRRLSRPVRKLE